MGIPVIPARKSILTKRINNQRGVCFYRNQCDRACSVTCGFFVFYITYFPSPKRRKVDLYTSSMVTEVTTDETGKAYGVLFINKKDRSLNNLLAKTVVLAASACSSARILLNSTSAQHPQGLGNNSGHVGRYLHDSTGASRAAFIPDLMDRDIYNEDGVGGMHVYTPWWLENANLDFPRGYHLEIGGGMRMPVTVSVLL